MLTIEVEYALKIGELPLSLQTQMPAWLAGVAGVIGIFFCTTGAAQQKPPVPSAKPAAKPAAAARAATAVRRPPRGPIEKYDCKIGTEDQHARIALQAQGGEVQSVAYYSKWKPRTCSVHLQRGDAFSQWKDTGDATTIVTEHGDFLIQASRGEYQLFFREVDRMHYCGMMGKLNGSMTVTRGPRRQCSVEGIMDRNEIEALESKEEPNIAAGAGTTSSESQQPGRAHAAD